jgi:hypothetical protein
VDVSPMPSKCVNPYEMLLQNGLKQNIQLIIAKAVIAISERNQIGNDSDSDFVKAFCMGLDFALKQSGWGQGLTITLPFVVVCSLIQKCRYIITIFDITR